MGLLLAACSSTSADSPSSPAASSSAIEESGSAEASQACAEFVQIATTIESDGPDADVGSQLTSIKNKATADGQTDVAEAAGALLSAQGGEEGQWYAALGKMEAACGPQGY